MAAEHTIKVSNIPALHDLVKFYQNDIDKCITEGLEYGMECPTIHPFSCDALKHIEKSYSHYRLSSDGLEDAVKKGIIDHVGVTHISQVDDFVYFKSGEDEFTVIVLTEFIKQIHEIMKTSDSLYSIVITDIDLSEVKQNVVHVDAITVSLGYERVPFVTFHGEIRSFGRERYKNILFY